MSWVWSVDAADDALSPSNVLAVLQAHPSAAVPSCESLVIVLLIKLENILCIAWYLDVTAKR